MLLVDLRTFALIVCAQRCCAGNATVICHASLRLTGPEDKHGVENAGEKKFKPAKLLWIISDPYFFNHESLTLLTIYKIWQNEKNLTVRSYLFFLIFFTRAIEFRYWL